MIGPRRTQPWRVPAVNHVAAQLTGLVLADFRLPRVRVDGSLEMVTEIARELVSFDLPLAYTAFDGDHLALAAQMRSYALEQGLVPVNPESVLGYKQLVDARGDKTGVMLDDLALVQRCDELLVFTDCTPEPDVVASELAEGAIAELLFFLGRCRGEVRPVRFVPVDALFGCQFSGRRYNYTYDETVRALGKDQKAITSLVEEIQRGDRGLPPVTCLVSDPLDAKYGHWVRAFAYGKGQTPVVPDIAIEMHDARVTCSRFWPGYAAICWTRLLAVADGLAVMGPVDTDRPESSLAALLRSVWLAATRPPIETPSWEDVGIPKAVHGRRWPLTEREGRVQ